MTESLLHLQSAVYTGLQSIHLLITRAEYTISGNLWPLQI